MPPATPAKGYTTTALIEAQLGRTLTDPQEAYCDTLLIPAAEDIVDGISGRQYGETAVVAESLSFSGPYTWLVKAPITTLTEIRGYLYGQTPESWSVVPETSYHLMDAATGYLWLPSWQNYAHLEADYLPDASIPANVILAATMVACTFLRTVLHPESEWLTDYSSAQDIRLKFRDTKLPDMVYTLLGTSSDAGIGSGGTIVVA